MQAMIGSDFRPLLIRGLPARFPGEYASQVFSMQIPRTKDLRSVNLGYNLSPLQTLATDLVGSIQSPAAPP